jgi:hypothetical protein
VLKIPATPTEWHIPVIWFKLRHHSISKYVILGIISAHGPSKWLCLGVDLS